jgi:hypothetical protein
MDYKLEAINFLHKKMINVWCEELGRKNYKSNENVVDLSVIMGKQYVKGCFSISDIKDDT